MKSLRKFFPATSLFISLISLWEFSVQTKLVSFHLLPAPSQIIIALITNWDVIGQHTLQTCIEAVLGLVLSIILGFLVAVLLDMSSTTRKAVYPLLVTSQTIPMLALAPLLLLWFGFDITPKVFIVLLSCFFPITIATLDGFAHIDRDYTKLLQSMRASYWQTLWYLKLPGSLPQFFSGLKIAATYSVTGAVVGEYVGAYQGLGIYMQEVAHSHIIALVFAVIFVISIVSLLLVGGVIIAEWLLLPWRRI